MKEFLHFDKMITPAIIKFIFWACASLSILAGFAMMFQGGLQVLVGLFIMSVGPIVSRIYCELLIVLFKMHESLHAINKNNSHERISA
ncbi:hypothetical protein CIB95_11795 [Lottiidibacillus patelloidae]|uniref:DUF4282 domain-containing protein n=1 Tax=Lottiidibacillus patelloidae TaxID=2670334 RepID=A0A263BRV7_9BACI|nr:DUF4282 domain-containing protein [Lottiidibacillus patelloidae]OZM56451.1 hypothetical protein CIB95_11795 [Lottiidibacillus patelloidae]